jgi:hypothetical protein
VLRLMGFVDERILHRSRANGIETRVEGRVVFLARRIE